jgi:hypothetical protein
VQGAEYIHPPLPLEVMAERGCTPSARGCHYRRSSPLHSSVVHAHATERIIWVPTRCVPWGVLIVYFNDFVAQVGEAKLEWKQSNASVPRLSPTLSAPMCPEQARSC